MSSEMNSVIHRGDNCCAETFSILKQLDFSQEPSGDELNILQLDKLTDNKVETVILNGSPAWTLYFIYDDIKYIIVDVDSGVRISQSNRSDAEFNQFNKHSVFVFKQLNSDWILIKQKHNFIYKIIKPRIGLEQLIRILTIKGIIKSLYSNEIAEIDKQIKELEQEQLKIALKIKELTQKQIGITEEDKEL